MKDDQINFDIIEHLGVLSTGARGWQREVNLVSWNDRPPKIDIRDWDEHHEKMGKGITLNREETDTLLEILGGDRLRDLEFP